MNRITREIEAEITETKSMLKNKSNLKNPQSEIEIIKKLKEENKEQEIKELIQNN